MSIFISYSHKDKGFVEKLGKALVYNKHNIWIDEWELNVGDSIINRIQETISKSEGLLVVLSKNSVESEWCKKEITSGLLRELEEKQVVVMPLLLDDCEIPLFLRDKLYADFRENFTSGLRRTLEAISKVANPNLKRRDENDAITDWSIDWGHIGSQVGLELTFINQAKGQPYKCLTQVKIQCDDGSSREWEAANASRGYDFANRQIICDLVQYINNTGGSVTELDSNRSVFEPIHLANSRIKESAYLVNITTRRLGDDTGRNILIHTDNLIKTAYEWLDKFVKERDTKS